MKKVLYMAIVLAIVFSLGACRADLDEHISGISFDPADYGMVSYETYQNKLYGILIEYPENYERIGNFDIDGYIMFEGKDAAIGIYIPYMENAETITEEEYVKEVLKLKAEEGSGITKYGRYNGYKAVRYDDEGNIRIDFVVKGDDAFYRFAYTTAAEDFDEENESFQHVMSSIRIDDGEYNSLTRMMNRYTVLLEYATSMQYITDANYANHCLNNYEQMKVEKHKEEALETSVMIREEIGKIIVHELEEGERFEKMWQEIVTAAEEIEAACEEAEACVKNGDYDGAQRIARTRFSYELSEHASKFLEMINAEIAEY